MSGGKETPRQKMIGMMYLVLTALLALNVSADVLDAFAKVNDGLETTYYSVDNKIDDYYNTFEQQYNKQPEKTAEVWKKAQDIRTKTDEMINFIEKEMKIGMLLLNEGVATEADLLNREPEEALILNPDQIDLTKNRRVFHQISLENVGSKDQYNNPTNFFIEQGNATVFRNKIDEYRQYVIDVVESIGLTSEYENSVGLITNGEYRDKEGLLESWEMHNFNHVITPAVISIINEIVTEVQTVEYDAISELYKSIGASDFKFNTLEAKVFPKTTYVLKGQDYEADVFIVASDDTKEFDAKYAQGVKDFSKASANAIRKVSSQKGIVKIKVPTNAEGEQTLAGVIEMKNPITGEVEPYPFQTSYTVAPPSANVTPTKMNVMYRGLENPIAISAPGFTANQINVEVTNGELVNNNGEYFVKPGNESNETTVTVSTTIDGKKVILDNCNFRLKRTPDPVPVLNGRTNDKFTKEEILATGGFVLTMPDFDFEGYNSEVIAYDVSTIVAGYLKPIKGIKGRKFNKEVEELIKGARRGQRINIENIRVKSPDGEERVLNTPIVIELKN